jgi:hypothetical protein
MSALFVLWRIKANLLKWCIQLFAICAQLLYSLCGMFHVTHDHYKLKSNTAGTTRGVGTAYPSGASDTTSVFIWKERRDWVAQSLVFCVLLCRSFSVCLSFCVFPFGPLYCLSFIHSHLLIKHLVSTNFPHNMLCIKNVIALLMVFFISKTNSDIYFISR